MNSMDFKTKTPDELIQHRDELYDQLHQMIENSKFPTEELDRLLQSLEHISQLLPA